MDLVKLTESIIKKLVADPDSVSVKEFTTDEENTIQIEVLISSDDMGKVIGKNGKTISALQNVIKQIIYTRTTHNLHIILDVENYKENRSKNIEYLAKKIAREVAQTKVEVKMDCMNSYERRIVHSTLAENKYVYTESIGEEPNRCVVIKPKDV